MAPQRLALTPPFTPGELGALREIVDAWIEEGFTTPPYRDEVYSIFEKLGLRSADFEYDIRRPARLH